MVDVDDDGRRSAGAADVAEELGSSPDVHALERLEVGYELGQIVEEYVLLRSIVLRRWREDPSRLAQVGPLSRLDRAFDVAVLAAVHRAEQSRNRVLAALELISTIGAEASPHGLTELLSRLVAAIATATELVDSATILLREGDRLYVRAAVGLRGESDGNFSLPVGKGFAGTIAAEARPIELSDARDPLVLSPTLRHSGIRALFGVPLMLRGEVIGVAWIGSRRASAFTADDRMLFRAMAARATDFVVLAQLRAREEVIQRAAEAAAQRHERQLRLLIDTLPQIVWTARADGVIDFVNAAWIDYTGVTPEAVREGAWRDAIHPDDRDEIAEVWERSIASREPFEKTARLCDPEGQPRWFLLRGVPLFDDDGAVLRWVGSCTDIDAEKRARDHAEEQHAELREALGYRDRIIGVLAHDLRNPLTAITLNLEVLLRRTEHSPAVLRMLTRINHSARRMQQIIDDLLDFSRVRAHEALPTDPERIDLGEIASRIIAELELQYPEYTITLKQSGDQSAVLDPVRVGQLLSNLIGNACRYGDPKRPVLVDLSSEGGGPDSSICILVQNFGTPIPPAMIGELFKPFRRGADASERAGGLGLGLFIVREIVRAHQGTIEVLSDEKDGTRFTVRLPRSGPYAAASRKQ
jgi:PAS domain S-box-containing protein